MSAPLGRFGHHPDPAIDFCIEVEEIQSISYNRGLGLTGYGHEADYAALPRRMGRAMEFRVGGDLHAINAKALLRKIEQDCRS